MNTFMYYKLNYDVGLTNKTVFLTLACRLPKIASVDLETATDRVSGRTKLINA